MAHVKDSLGHPDCQSVWAQDYEVGKGPADRIAKVAQQPDPQLECPHCGERGTLVRQPNGTLMCIDCYWEEGETLPPNDDVTLPPGHPTDW